MTERIMYLITMELLNGLLFGFVMYALLKYWSNQNQNEK